MCQILFLFILVLFYESNSILQYDQSSHTSIQVAVNICVFAHSPIKLSLIGGQFNRGRTLVYLGVALALMVVNHINEGVKRCQESIFGPQF